MGSSRSRQSSIARRRALYRDTPGESIAGDVLVSSAGLEEGEASREAFRAWLAEQAESIALRRPEEPGEARPTPGPRRRSGGGGQRVRRESA
jgi:hypothetical protein